MWKKLINTIFTENFYKKTIKYFQIMTIIVQVVCLACMLFGVPFKPLGYFILGGYVSLAVMVIILLTTIDYLKHKKNSHGNYEEIN